MRDNTRCCSLLRTVGRVVRMVINIALEFIDIQIYS